jgi:tripartite ATP-independent transporter DctM subunit
MIPPAGLFVVVVGSIYMGLATPTEAAAIGVGATVAIAAATGMLSWQMLREAFIGAMRTTCMVMFIVIGALFLNFILVATGGMASITGFVEHSGLSAGWTMTLIVGLYIVLGCFMDALAMVITTVPIITPIVVKLGYDPVWFGIIIVLVTETSLITPPIGVNLFVIQSIRGGGPISDVIIGSLPFVITMMVMIGIIFAWPSLALWLPTLFYR